MHDPALVDWLTRAEPPTADTWEPDPPIGDLQCDPDLVQRLALIARPVHSTARVFVAGCPVIHITAGRPIACASGTSWFVVRSGRAAGELAPPEPVSVAPLDDAWTGLDPWTHDIALARGVDLLRAHVARAVELARED